MKKTQPPKKEIIYALVFLGVFLILVLIFSPERVDYVFKGTQIDPPAEILDFTLVQSTGEEFRLADQKGKVVLMFFGYTHCPDVCPATLTDYARVYKLLGDRADDVTYVYITVDPERDSPELVSTYVNAFNPAFIGLSGSEEELQPVYNYYGVYREKQFVESAESYLYAHTSIIYVIDKKGRWRENFPFELSPEEMAEDILFLLKE